jgi:hypothetical protein
MNRSLKFISHFPRIPQSEDSTLKVVITASGGWHTIVEQIGKLGHCATSEFYREIWPFNFIKKNIPLLVNTVAWYLTVVTVGHRFDYKTDCLHNIPSFISSVQIHMWTNSILYGSVNLSLTLREEHSLLTWECLSKCVCCESAIQGLQIFHFCTAFLPLF